MGWTHTLDELAAAIGADARGQSAVFHGVSTDTRTLQPGQVFFALTGKNFDGNDFVGAAFSKCARAVVAGQGLPGAEPCLVVPDVLKALQAFAAYHRGRHPIPLIALTGSCGKTSAKDMAASVLATKYTVVKTPGNLNNDIGCPLSLLNLDRDTEIAVIEMGANHLGEIAGLCAMARPTESAITMIAPAHLEGFGSMDNVAKAKAEIVECLSESDTFYVNVDDPWCVRIGDSFPGKKVRFGRSGDVALEACAFDESGRLRLRIAPIGELSLPLYCRAHATNVILAVAIGLNHGVSEFEEPLIEACRASARFRIISLGPLQVLDDTYNANPASMEAALQALADRPARGRRIAALGDMLELGESARECHRHVGELAGQAGVACLFGMGEYACDTIAAARAVSVPHAEVLETHRAIAEAIHAVAEPEDVLLVKGSRGMQMERVIEALRGLYS